MSVEATVTSQPITASVSGGTVAASVPAAAAVSASVSGGVGPQGPAGNSGNLGDLQDVQLVGLATGDVLRRDGSKWKNYQDAALVDGGNY